MVPEEQRLVKEDLEAFLIIVLKQTVEGIEKIKGQGKIT
jgi:hypothetical protein